MAGAIWQMKMHKLVLFTSAAALLAVPAAIPVATAQEGAIDKRVERLEKEMRAVQRSVFPGGNPTFFEGEIAPDNVAGERVRSNAPVIDLTARVDALEAQLQALTGQTEQNAFQLRELDKKFAAYKAEIDKRLSSASAGDADQGAAVATPASLPPKKTAPKAETPSKPDASRLALVKKVEIPATGNEVDDAYTYGYRLWDAKLYPEAQAQLKTVVSKWPDHRMASFAQNLLGRAYLDEGKPSLAAVAFYNNYKDRPSGARAPHSLMYMGVALDRLGRKADACKAFRELDEVYGDKAPQDVRSDAAAAKAKAGC